MNHFSRWAVIAGAVLLAVITGTIAYNAGVTHGIEQSGKLIAVPVPGGAPVGAIPYYHGWHRPWGGGFFFAPFVFIAFWLLIVRGLFWRGGWHRRGCGPDGSRYDGGGRFEEWHRRMHERMANDPTGGGAPQQ
jgi:hypothetical protein